MIELYPEIRITHITAVFISGGLFVLRGIGLMLNMKWPMVAPVRYLTYSIDTVLLTAALILTTIVQQYPFTHSWLTVKVILLFVYIFLGVMAFRRDSRTATRFGFWLAAIFVYIFMITVARAHHPLGVFIN